MSKERLNPGWPALANLRKLLPLDDDSLQQILDYSVSIPRDQAAEHLKNLLGDSEESLQFISSFNAKRVPVQSTVPEIVQPTSSQSSDGHVAPVPKVGPKRAKNKFTELNKLPPPRQVEGYGNLQGAYVKRDEEDYVKGIRRDLSPRSPLNLSSGPVSSLETSPIPSKSTTPAREVSPAPSSSKNANKLPPSASGTLISDLPKSKSKSKTTKVSITGGTPMKGASTALTDLESAIRVLEIQTNPSLLPTAKENERRRCNCMGTKHPLLTAAPNCLNCGKIICVKEGIGPCTFCGNPLLDAESIDAMIRVLVDERGREKQAIGNAAHRRAEVSRTPRPFSSPLNQDSGSEAEGKINNTGLFAAEKHRDKLLAFQAQNAKRTRIHDEAADFETPSAGVNIWASPVERAMQLKRQQKALREQEWNARPEWERKKVVASIDIVGGKAVKRIARVDRPPTPESEDDEIVEVEEPQDSKSSFGRNPLLGGLIRPVVKTDVTGENDKAVKDTSTKWRRVQDDGEDNEKWILNGPLLGKELPEVGNTDEPPCG